MDQNSDVIDPSWWEIVLSSVELFEPPELLSGYFERAASDPEVTGMHELVLQVLATASSAMLDPEKWLEPFTPAMQFHDKRTIVPSDMNDAQVALLARIAPMIKRDVLRARVADVAWVYGDRSDIAMMDKAIDAYRAAPLIGDVWFSVGRDSWIRAFALVARRGADGKARVKEMSAALKAEILVGEVSDGYTTVQFAEALRQHGQVDAGERREVCEALIALAAQSLTTPRLSRHLDREAVAWIRNADVTASNAAIHRIANTYVAEADSRIETDPDSGALVEGHFLEKAIAVLLTLPRSYRLSNDLDKLVAALRVRLHESRESSVEQMMRIQSDPVDLTDAVSYARSRVSGHADKFDALAAFATLAPPMDAAGTRESAVTRLEGTISHAFASSTISSDFRKVAASPGSSGGADQAAIWAEMVRTVHFHSQLVGTGVILPAQEVITTEHQFSLKYLVSLCSESPAVPQGHEVLWGNGLALGLGGNYGAAVSVLVPQLEQAIRVILKRQGAYTLFVDDQGVESEKSLNALLDMAETTEIFGAGMVIEMKAMLVVQGGPNLRNDVAHGLLTDGEAWSYSALFMWWFCLRLVMHPVIAMADRNRRHASATSDEHAATRTETASGEETTAPGDAEEVPDIGTTTEVEQ